MPVYQYSCRPCRGAFEARRPVAMRDQADCPACQGPASRVFRPDWIAILTPESLKYVRSDFEPLSTPTHTSSYLAGRVVDDHVNAMYASQAEAAKNAPESFERYFQKRNPDLDLNTPLTKQESLDVKAALGAING